MDFAGWLAEQRLAGQNLFDLLLIEPNLSSYLIMQHVYPALQVCDFDCPI